MASRLVVRQALRRVRRQPAFLLTSSVTLAVAIGGGTAVAALGWALLLAPLPYAHPHELVVVQGSHDRRGVTPVAPADFLDWQREARSFVGMSAWRTQERTLFAAGEPRSIEVLIASPNLFEVLRPAIALGHGWT